MSLVHPLHLLCMCAQLQQELENAIVRAEQAEQRLAAGAHQVRLLYLLLLCLCACAIFLPVICVICMCAC